MLELIYSLEEVKESADQIIKDLIAYRKELVSVSKEKNPIAAMLVKSANPFAQMEAFTFCSCISFISSLEKIIFCNF